jgi:hypothetical protein
MSALTTPGLAALLALSPLPGCADGPIGGEGEARLELTSVPVLGSHSMLHGQVTHVDPDHWAVATYVYLGEDGGWWNRPSAAQPTTPIRASGSFSVDVTTEDGDAQAEAFAAFLIPSGEDAPRVQGDATLPDSLIAPPPPHDGARRTPHLTERMLFFSERAWTVRATDILDTPGPNIWADDHDAVWVDPEGALHLVMLEREGEVLAAEVALVESLGYGTYVFSLDTPIRQRNEFTVVGLFVRDTLTEAENKEFDIEFARWADPDGPDAQFVVAPWQVQGNGETFTVGPLYEPTIHASHWAPDHHLFTSAIGHDWPPAEMDVLRQWYYDGESVMAPGNDRTRINLWLFRFLDPPEGVEEGVELVVRRFDYLP